MELQILPCEGPTGKGATEESSGACRVAHSPVREPKLKTGLRLIYMSQGCVYGTILL